MKVSLINNRPRIMNFISDIVRGGLIFSEKSILKKNGGAFAEFEGGETVLFNTDDRRSYLLNRSAWEVYKLTDGKRSVRKITEIIKRNYRVGTNIIKKDIKKIYKGFLKRGIVSHVER